MIAKCTSLVQRLHTSWFKLAVAMTLLIGGQGYAQTCNPDKPYDHIVSSFHQTAVQRTDGSWAGWGATMGSLGLTGATGTTYDGRSVPRPLDIKAGGTWEAAGGSWPSGQVGLVGEPLLITLASANATEQTVALTTQGLFSWGFPLILNSSIKSATRAAAFAVDGKTDGLPPGVSPTDVAQLFGSYRLLAVVTKPAHGGQLWVLVNHAEAGFTNLRGDGSIDIASNNKWHRVKIDSATDLNNVVAVRGQVGGLSGSPTTLGAMMAQTADGKLYAWGNKPYFGNGAAATPTPFATPMTLPQEGGADIAPMMIGVTGNAVSSTMFVLSTTGTLYSVGANNQRQLGANLPETSAEVTTWQVVHGFGETEATWRGKVKSFSVQEHDSGTTTSSGGAAGALITVDDTVYTWGSNHNGMIGRATTAGGVSVGANTIFHLGQPVTTGGALPARLVEVGGHTMVYLPKDSAQFCYVGHQVNGSMGDGVIAGATQNAFNCSQTPVVNICGATGFDNGDAPSVYENGGGSNQAMHAYTNNILFLGALPPQASDDLPKNVVSGASNVGANGDFIASPLTLEEDGITQSTGPMGNLTAVTLAGGDLPVILTTQTTYTMQVAYTNQTGTAAAVHAWVDWNDNGIFETSEYASAPAVGGSGSVALSWPAVSSLTEGYRYIRLRITTKTGSSPYNELFPAANVTIRGGEDARALGFAADGEIEDHRVRVVSSAVVANPDTDSTAVGIPVSTPVVTNDTALGGGSIDPASVKPTGTQPPANGTVTCSAGACTYTPNPGFIGTDTYTYEVCLAAPNAAVCGEASVTVTITAASPSIQANPDTATTPAGTPISTPVVTNDTALGGGSIDPASVKPTGTQPPANGTV
ncbi:alpha-tubulin suppressor-like RCC1 family protein, partial [Comamonas sp. 4034]